jgi:hypothetical protein
MLQRSHTNRVSPLEHGLPHDHGFQRDTLDLERTRPGIDSANGRLAITMVANPTDISVRIC